MIGVIAGFEGLQLHQQMPRERLVSSVRLTRAYLLQRLINSVSHLLLKIHSKTFPLASG